MSLKSIFGSRVFAAFLAVAMVAAAIMLGINNAPPPQPDYFYVADYAEVLSAQAEQYIAGQSDAVAQRTGARFFVVTVKNTGTRDIYDYLKNLMNAWGFNETYDVILLLDIGGDDYWFEYGSYWWDTFDYTYSDLMYYYLEPDFAARRYEAGVLAFYDAVCAELGRDAGAHGYVAPANTVAYAASVSWRMINIVAVIFVIFLILIILSGTRRGYGYGRRRSIFAPRRPRYYGYGRTYRPFYHTPPRRPAPPRRPPTSGGFFGGTHGGGRSSSGPRPGSGSSPFGGGTHGGGRSSGGSSRPSSFGGGSRPSGGGRSSFGGSGRSSGGGRSGGGGSRGGGRGGKR